MSSRWSGPCFRKSNLQWCPVGRVRKAHRPGLAVIRVSGDERQEGFLEGGGNGGSISCL